MNKQYIGDRIAKQETELSVTHGGDKKYLGDRLVKLETTLSVAPENKQYLGDRIAAVENAPRKILADPVLGNNTPEMIRKVAQSGQAANLWCVGDRVAIELSGTFGAIYVSKVYFAFIIGFDHNSSLEGSNRIHFMFGMSSLGSRNLAFSDSNYDTQISVTGFTMYSSNSNEGGWANSSMRKNVMAQFYLYALPSRWRAVIAPCNKYSNYGSAGSATPTVFSDNIFLLSEYEVFGANTNANTIERNYHKQYDYFARGGRKVFYKQTSNSTACSWWLRSTNSTTGFCAVDTKGAPLAKEANYSLAICPAFSVG